VLGEELVIPVFQPVVDLESGRVVAYEALARGPRGGLLEQPDALFAVAREADRLAELDSLCRWRAVALARDAELPAGLGLFVNVEPDALAMEQADDLDAPADLRPFAEITERALTARPAELLAEVARLREHGWGVALDDVGADPRSLALMPLVRPDVIKLDLRLVQEQPDLRIAEIVNAVLAERERSGVSIVAEGIETEEHLATARAMGATLGQGWLFGIPEPLPERTPEWAPAPPRVQLAAPTDALTPYQAVVPGADVRRSDKALLLAMSLHLEREAGRVGPGAIVLSSFQHAKHFTPKTARRYERLAARSSFVVALGARIDEDDPLLGEWGVVVLGPHFSGALAAIDLGDDGPDMQRRFDYVITYDRAAVVDAAHTLARRVERLS
jgi:EAL domain-containing protein (putative c-di-GMP-specific phosphodiesterase class I)